MNIPYTTHNIESWFRTRGELEEPGEHGRSSLLYTPTPPPLYTQHLYRIHANYSNYFNSKYKGYCYYKRFVSPPFYLKAGFPMIELYTVHWTGFRSRILSETLRWITVCGTLQISIIFSLIMRCKLFKKI